MKTWVPPKDRQRTVNLPSGKAVLYITHRMDKVDVKLKAFGQYLRNSDGKIKTEKFPVKSTQLRLKFDDGRVLKSRSCVKPPDKFDPKAGVWIAFEHLRKQNELSKQDWKVLVPMMMWYSPKAAIVHKKPDLAPVVEPQDVSEDPELS